MRGLWKSALLCLAIALTLSFISLPSHSQPAASNLGSHHHFLTIGRSAIAQPIYPVASPADTVTISQSALWSAVAITFIAGSIVGILSNLFILSLLNRFSTRGKAAQQEREDAERARLIATLAAGEVGTWELDLVDNRVWGDRQLGDMLGVETKPGMGRPVADYLQAIHAEDRDRVEADLRQSIANGDAYRSEYRVTKTNGETLWLLGRGCIERNSNDQPIRMPGVVLDITALKAAQMQLAASEQRFRQIADALPQIVWVTDAEGAYEYFNQRFYDYTGFSSQANTTAAWKTLLYPEHRAADIDLWHRSIRTGDRYETEQRLRGADGKYRWFLVRALPVKDTVGNITNWFGTCTDIEDAKRLAAERRNFVLLAENSPEFVGMCDLAGKPFYANKSALQKIGLSKEDLYERNIIEDLLYPEDQNRIASELFPYVIEHGSGSTEVRLRHAKTNAAIWMVFNVIRLTDEKGQPTGLATVSQDITERRQMEDDLRQLASDLTKADRHKDEFLATLAHELRNPLAPIRNGLQIMQIAEPDSSMIPLARDMMERQVALLVRLVDDLLEVSRLSRGKIELHFEKIDVKRVIELAIETSWPTIAAAQQTVEQMIPEQPLRLRGDVLRLTQAVSNLLNNASKYSASSEKITVSAGQENEQIWISVKDNGIGISAGMMPKIFDMFAQASVNMGKTEGGLGLGLTLAKQLVEMHGGSIQATSAGEGQGSEFVIRLPLIGKRSPLLSEPSPSEPTPMSTRRILVVDDNEDSALSLSMLFEITGDETHTVHDGPSAISAAESFTPDIVLLDIGLPEMDGYEVAQAIRQQPWGKQMVIVALTGWGQPEDRQKSIASGCNAHLVKPVDHDELLKLLGELEHKA